MKGDVTDELRRAGWNRSDLPAELLNHCGWAGEYTGWCERRARWTHRYAGAVCAQHAYVMLRTSSLHRGRDGAVAA